MFRDRQKIWWISVTACLLKTKCSTQQWHIKLKTSHYILIDEKAYLWLTKTGGYTQQKDNFPQPGRCSIPCAEKTKDVWCFMVGYVFFGILTALYIFVQGQKKMRFKREWIQSCKQAILSLKASTTQSRAICPHRCKRLCLSFFFFFLTTSEFGTSYEVCIILDRKCLLPSSHINRPFSKVCVTELPFPF